MPYLTQREILQAVQAYEADINDRLHHMYSREQLEGFQRAAVLIPMFEHENQWHILLTLRSDSLEAHRGQVAFPGGGYEKPDNNLCDTALREMHEEIGVKPEDVLVFGHLGDMPVVTGYLVRPFVGQIPWPHPFDLASEEVQSIFSIPIAWLADPKNRHHQFRSYAGREFPVVFFEQYDGYQLWGASAEMTLALLTALKLIS
jgi:8-oxo-dGTP pyrophosphatase MutT (NUDIX family)